MSSNEMPTCASWMKGGSGEQGSSGGRSLRCWGFEPHCWLQASTQSDTSGLLGSTFPSPVPMAHSAWLPQLSAVSSPLPLDTCTC